MAMIYQALELKAHPGRFRMCGQSDEEKNTFVELCNCACGHDSAESARNCPIAKEKLERIFPPVTDLEGLLGKARAALVEVKERATKAIAELDAM